MLKAKTQDVREAGAETLASSDEPPNETDRRARSITRWRIGQKLTAASVLMIALTLLAGGVGLWQVLTIGQAISDAREKAQQQVWSLELLATGHELIAALSHMLLVQNSLLTSTDVAPFLANLNFYMETMQEGGEEIGITGFVEEMQIVYGELRQAVHEIDLLARSERWTEASAALEQKIKPANERMGILVERLVRQANRDAEATALRVKTMTQQATLGLAILVVLTTAIALSWRQFVFRGLGLSISELRQGVARISSGDLEYELDIRTGDEIGELSDEFNKMAGEMADVIGSLEQRVADRTRGLRAAAEVSQATTSVLDPDELLRQTVNLIRERFELYYVGLFLLDQEKQFAVLQASTGEAGQQMLAQGHRLEVGGESMIGQCVARSEARITLDVGEEAARFDNPLLPETRTELALPLRSRGRVIGAASVQSAQEAAFDEEDIAIMQTMADQVAVAIDNARLFVETQAALQEAEATHRHYLRQAWTAYLAAAQVTGYDTAAAHPGDTALSRSFIKKAIQQTMERQGATVLTGNGEKGETDLSALVVPITLRDEVIGILGIHDDKETRQWSDEEIALAETIVERMALAAENLRLLDETQSRAAQEQLISEVSARMHETLDIETVLQTTAYQVRQALGLPKVVVRLTPSLPTSGTQAVSAPADGDSPPGPRHKANNPAPSDAEQNSSKEVFV